MSNNSALFGMWAATALVMIASAHVRLRQRPEDLRLATPGGYRLAWAFYIFAVFASHALLAPLSTHFLGQLLARYLPLSEFQSRGLALVGEAVMVTLLVQGRWFVGRFSRLASGRTDHTKVVEALDRSSFAIPDKLQDQVQRLVADCGVKDYATEGASPSEQIEAADRRGMGTAWAQITSLVIYLEGFESKRGPRWLRRARTAEVRTVANTLKVSYQRLAHRTARLFQLWEKQERFGGFDKLARADDEPREAFAARTLLQEAVRTMLVFYRADAKGLTGELVDLVARASHDAGSSPDDRLAFLRNAGFRSVPSFRGWGRFVAILVVVLVAVALLAWKFWEQLEALV